MEQFSVVKTPAYPKYYGKLSRPQYSERSGYTISCYQPVYDLELKIPGLGIAEVPFIPIQKSNRAKKPFVPRCLTEQDMIQINLKAERKARDILKDFHPSQKVSYESANDFRLKKEIENRIEDIRESFANVHAYFRKAEKFDITRKYSNDARSKCRFTNKHKHHDIILDCTAENVDDIKKKLMQDTNNCKAKFRMHVSACKKDKVSMDFDEGIINNEVATARKESSPARQSSSRVPRCQQLEALKEKNKTQETESDYFERSFGKKLSKLRVEVNSLTHLADDFIAASSYHSSKLDHLFRKK